jgi:hypothetical protein
MGRFRRFWNLTRREKVVFFEACVLLLTSNLSIKTVAFRYIDRSLRHWTDHGRNTFVRSDDIKNDIKLIDLSLSRATNVLPWNCLCLSRSMAKLIMLRRRGIPAILFAGVKSLEDSSLSAHAWVRTDVDVMDMNLDRAENAEFTVLVRIGQGSFAKSSGNSI